MRKVILIKYAELTTKKANIGLFLSTLKRNIEEKLKEEHPLIVYDKGRMILYPSEENIEIVIEKLQTIFGIHAFLLAYELKDTSLQNITTCLKNWIKEQEITTFKVETKRSNKSYPMTSVEINAYLGSVILQEKPNSKVDVHHPEHVFYVEIRRDSAYLSLQSINGLGGYPVGTLGKGILMLSGGIDSPVAGYLAMKRGVKIEAVYFESPPHTSVEAKNKVIALANILSNYQISIRLHVIPFTKIQEEIYKNIPKEYMITIMRRMMYRITEKIAHNRNAHVIINGESIGQVASQTLTSMEAINEVVSIPVIRPVACFDKLEIIELANKIATYETSILPYMDCCTIFVPEHPVIHPDKYLCREYEKKIPYEEYIKEALSKEEVLSLPQKEKYTNYL